MAHAIVYHPNYQTYNFGPAHPFSPVRLVMLVELLEALGSGWTANSHSFIALGMLWDGRWDEAIAHAEQAAELEQEDNWAGADHAALLLLHAYRGDGQRVRAVLDAAHSRQVGIRLAVRDALGR